MQAFDTRTLSNEIVPSSTKAPKSFDLSPDVLVLTGTQDEFDIDGYIDQQDKPTQEAIAAESAWVAETLYPGACTLATLRLKAGLSQRQFADKCGLAQPHVSRYESGRHEPGIFQAETMARVLGVSLEIFVTALRQGETGKTL